AEVVLERPPARLVESSAEGKQRRVARLEINDHTFSEPVIVGWLRLQLHSDASFPGPGPYLSLRIPPQLYRRIRLGIRQDRPGSAPRNGGPSYRSRTLPWHDDTC